MAVSSGIITAPVSIGDVATCLGVGSYDLGTLCVSDKINKWALYKPVNVAQIGEITLAQRKAVYCGLYPQQNVRLLQANANYSGTQVDHDLNAVMETQKEWGYTKPSGYYRLTDFINSDNPTASGYRDSENAKSSDNGWGDYTFTLSDLQACVDKSYDYNSGTYDWSLVQPELALASMNIRFGLESWLALGNVNNIEIPITYIVGDGIITSEYWRIGFAVYLPTFSGTGKWQLFVSNAPLSSGNSTSTTISKCIPYLATNQQALNFMINSGQKTFNMVPCLVKNALFNKYNGKTYVGLSGDSVVYSVPSGFKKLTFKIDDSGEKPPVVGGLNVIGWNSSKTWVIGYVVVDNTGSPYYKNSHMLILCKTSPIASDTEVVVDYTLLYMSSASSDAYTSESKHYLDAVKAGTSITVNGYTYNGLMLGSGLLMIADNIVFTKP